MLKRICDKCGVEIKYGGECMSFMERRLDFCDRCARDIKEFLTPDKIEDTHSKPLLASDDITCDRCAKPMRAGYAIQKDGKILKVCSNCYREIMKRTSK